MAESLAKEQRGTAGVPSLRGWHLNVAGPKEPLSCGVSCHRSRLVTAVFWLAALSVGAAVVYLCFCHWLAAVIVAAIVLVFYVPLCLVSDYAPGDRESHLTP